MSDHATRPRYDEAAAWHALHPSAQEDVGRAAIALQVARHGMEVAQDEGEKRAFVASMENAMADLQTLLDDVIDYGEIPGIPASLGQVCRKCGCSDFDACGGLLLEPCDWAEDDLCSACAPASADV